MIEIKGLKKAFGEKVIIQGLDLTINTGTFMVVVGRSGEGKSVLLKQIIGLLKPDDGNIVVDGLNITQLAGKELQDVYKKFGYVFQFAALLDSLTVFQNIAIVDLENGVDPASIRPKVLEKLRAVGLNDDVANKFPDELSGGMKKRVGLARTLMLDPQIILYDEPTTGLDPISVRLIHELIYQTHKASNATTIVISHDVDIFNYADEVAMLYEGKIVFQGPCKEIWKSDDPYVYQFIRGLGAGPIKSLN